MEETGALGCGCCSVSTFLIIAVLLVLCVCGFLFFSFVTHSDISSGLIQSGQQLLSILKPMI